MSLETPTRSHRASPPITLNWRLGLLASILLIDAAYIVLIFSGVSLIGHEQFLPPQINQVIVGALIVGTVTAVGLVIGGRITARIEDAVVVMSAVAANLTDDVTQVKETTKELSGQIARVKDRLGMREDDDPTVGLRYQPTPTVQHVIGVASVYGARTEGAVDRAVDRILLHVDSRIDARLGDIEELAVNAAAAGMSGKVTRLPLARS